MLREDQQRLGALWAAVALLYMALAWRATEFVAVVNEDAGAVDDATRAVEAEEESLLGAA